MKNLGPLGGRATAFVLAVAAGLPAAMAGQIKYLSLDTNAGLTLFDNAQITTGSGGKFGEGLLLDGANDYATVVGGYAPTPLGTGARTVSVWFNRAAIGSAADPVGLGFNGGGTKFDLELDNGTGEMETAIGSGRTVDANTGGWVVGQWHLGVMSAPAGVAVPGIKTYLDALLRANTSSSATAVNTDDPTSSFNPAPGTTNMLLGTSSNTVTSGAAQFSFNGVIDDVAIWDEELSQDEVNALLFVGNSLGYAANSFDALKTVHDNAAGSTTIGSSVWNYVAGGLPGNSANAVVFDSANGSGVSRVPEPAALALAGLAACGLAARRRRNA